MSDYQTFLALEPVWNELIASSGLNHPFGEHLWHRTWWECFGGGCAFRVLVAWDGGEPIGIAPLILKPARMCGINANVLGFFYNDHVPRADFIIARNRPEAYHAIWKHLREDNSWDVLQLSQLTDDSETRRQILLFTERDRFSSGVWQSCASPYLPLTSSYEAYASSLAAKHRANLRNRNKRLRAMGEVHSETICSNRDLNGDLADLCRLEAAAWKGEENTAIACSPQRLRFYSLLAERSAERDWLRLHFLRAGNARVACDFSLEYNNRLFLLKTGYDPAYAAYSPYNLLLESVLHSAFEKGLVEYDLLGDNLDWKSRWTSLVRPHEWLFVFGESLKGRLLHTAKFQVAPLLKRVGLRAPAGEECN